MRRKNDSKNELVKAILEEYKPETAKDVQDAIKYPRCRADGVFTRSYKDKYNWV